MSCLVRATIGARAFDGAMSLTGLEFPTPCNTQGGLARTQKRSSLERRSGDLVEGHKPHGSQHLIVRGGVRASWIMKRRLGYIS